LRLIQVVWISRPLMAFLDAQQYRMANGFSISAACMTLRDYYSWTFPNEEPPTVDPKAMGNVRYVQNAFWHLTCVQCTHARLPLP
jgi:hypothetical protein